MSAIAMPLCVPALLCAEARFAQPPTAEADGTGVKISFAVEEATDVEVAVLDAAGRVVRHLAAGRLGASERTGLIPCFACIPAL